MLYHYTDAPGLLGMLGNPNNPPELWMNHIQYMNDHHEWWDAYKLMYDTIEKMRHHPKEEIRELARLKFPDDVSKKASNPEHYGGSTRAFVFSLSRDGDLLSQWRSYAPNGGYSIGFDFSDLRSIAKDNNFKLQKCVYEVDKKQELIDQLLEDLVIGVQDGNTLSEKNDDDLQKGDQDAVLSWAKREFHQRFNQFCTYFKNESFKEEREWRLVGVMPAGGTDERERWRTKKDQILPYCTIALKNYQIDTFPIRQVITGPEVDYRLAQHSISYVRYGQPGIIQVGRSTSSLRR